MRTRWESALAVTLGLALSTLGVTPVAAAGHGGQAAKAETAGSGVHRAAGVPADPTVVYSEDFENGMAGLAPIRLPAYTGATGMTYTASPSWLAFCNGWVMDYDERGPVPAECKTDEFWNTLADVATAIGEYSGDAAPTKNHSVAAWTEDGTYTPTDIQLQTNTDIPVTGANHYLTASIASGAVCYDGAYADPQQNFFLTAGGTETPLNTVPLNPCTDPGAKTYTYPDAKAPIKAVQATANKPYLFTGSQFGIILRNSANTGSGNDAAFDNIRVLDVTPQIDKSFSPSPAPVGGTSTLTFTITNTSDLLAKAGWSFTDNLPAGLTVAGTPNTATTCTNGTVTADAGGTSVKLAGDLTAGQASCTLSVDVTSATAATYQNCAANTADLVGLLAPECATVEFAVPQYTITKTASPASGSTVHPGDKVSYTVTVENTGRVPVDATAVDDLTAVLDDATYDGDAEATAGTATYAAPKLSWSGTLAAGDSATITYSVTVNNPDGGDGKLDNSVTGNGYSNCTTGTEAGCTTHEDATGIEVTKTADTATAKPGQKVTYTVTVTNLVGAPRTGVSVSDDLTKVLDDAAYGNDAKASSGTVAFASPTLTWNGDLAASQSVTITYSVTVNQPDTGDHQLANAVVGPADSNCAAGSTDRACSSTVPIAELKIAKSSDAKNPVKPGDKITYTVVLTNPGTAPYTGASITDDLGKDLDDATYDNDAKASSGTVSYAAPVLSWNGVVPAGGSVTITYSVTVDKPAKGDKQVTNAVVGPADSNCPPGGSDPVCSTAGNIAQLTVAKTSDAQNPVKAGDKVTYTVTVTNTGTAPYPGASVTDDLSGDLDDAVYNGDAKAGSGTVSYAAPVVSWTGDVPAGQSVTVTYSVTVGNPDTGDYELANAVTGPADSNCPPGAKDPRCTTRDRIAALQVTKTSDSRRAPVRPGTKVTYTVTVTNPGKAVYPAATLSDDLSRDLDDAAYDNDAKAVNANGTAVGTATYAAPVLSWTGDVAPGETITLTYSVRVNKPDTGDKELANTVVAPNGSNCQAGGSDPACSTSDDIADLAITKTSDAKNPVKPGDTVTYTVAVTNDGTADYPAAFATDDLSGDLDDAAYNGDAKATSGTLTYREPTLAWAGAVPAGQTVTLTYSVTVDNPDTGDHQLTNTVTGPNNSTCPPRRSAPGCTTADGIADLAITKTSDAKDPVKDGDRVTYTVTVQNTGKADYPGASVTDDLGGDLDDAVYGGDAKATSGTVSYAAPVLSWTGDVPAGGAATITYSVTVNNPDTGDRELANTVTGPADSNCPAGSTDTACSTHDKTVPNPAPSPSPTPGPAPLPDTGTDALVWYAGMAAALAIAAGTVLTTARTRRSRP
ncbi:DUF7507 domain-containing protein [Kitasatospora phosalacinea]|uniref:DUF11 domain-containing protein n=1 Tax=Kitasatospora phosalacinea TaxID=2065 RepID=A0A9W6PJL7_9ACTN|nr:isopeptide-forming domain-containing fimbrial protein [Kitasatospora phosalacinea]GLW57470.1 hypothetical protein Kpho01_54810 [Kitasatospora phosalacinea]